jgi:hypothetical protein
LGSKRLGMWDERTDCIGHRRDEIDFYDRDIMDWDRCSGILDTPHRLFLIHLFYFILFSREWTDFVTHPPNISKVLNALRKAFAG